MSLFSTTEFRECFYLYARSGQIHTMDELTVIMRSLGVSPTIAELRDYMKLKGGKMAFADFLDVMHIHRCWRENMAAKSLYYSDECHFIEGTKRASPRSCWTPSAGWILARGASSPPETSGTS